MRNVGVQHNTSKPIVNKFLDPLCTAPYSGGGALGVANTRWFGGAGSAGIHTIVTGATDGPAGITSYKRKTWTTTSAGGQNTADTGFDLPTQLYNFPSSVGSYITVGWWFRATSVGYKLANVSFYHNAGGRYGTPVVTLNNGVWTWVEATYQVPPSRPDVTLARPTLDIVNKTGASTLWQVGDTLDITGITITRDSRPLGAALHGDLPGWRWAGTAGSSESVGRLYTLESIAGTSIASITGDTGTVPLTTAQISPLAGRTTYCVSDRLALNLTGGAVIHGHVVPGGANSSGHIRTSLNGAFEFRPQFVGGGGAGAAYSDVYSTTIPAVGTRNIYSIGQFEGLTGYEHEVNGGVPRGKTGLDAGQGYTESQGIVSLRGVAGATTYEVPVFTVQFKGYHSYETRLRVTAWLARRFNAPIPSGF